LSSFSFSSLIPGGKVRELNNSLAMHSGTPEVEAIQSPPVMQDMMSSFGIDIFGPSGACQNEELPHLTSSDSITSTTL